MRKLKTIEDIKEVFTTQGETKFTFIDLFAGIGGFRLALQNLGGKCVFSSEIDFNAAKTYAANFGEIPEGDITLSETKRKIPRDFDILCAGIPCQSFSMMGKRLGLYDPRGTMFSHVLEIVAKHKPKVIFIENVKGLMNHDKGRTIQFMLKGLKTTGYDVVPPQIVNAANFGVAQNRERVYIIAFRKDLCVDVNSFKYPEPTDTSKVWLDVREKEPVAAKYYMSASYLDTLRKHKNRNTANGNGFGYDIIKDDGKTNTILATGGSGKERNLVIDPRQKDMTCDKCRKKGGFNNEYIRVMTPREWARLQGFPDNFRIVVADGPAYKQFGNAVAVPAIQATASQILKEIRRF